MPSEAAATAAAAVSGYLAAKAAAEGRRRTGAARFQSALRSIRNQSFGDVHVSFGPRDHVASTFVDLSMLTEDGKVRR